MNITPVRIYINGNGSISFYGPNNTLITNLQNLNGAKQSNGQIIFDGDDKTISFYVYQLTSIESATFSLPYSALDSRFFNPSVYSAKLNNVYQDVAEYVLVNKNGGASFVGGVVATYPNFASFPATGQEAVIYIDEATNEAYFWNGTSYQLLVSTGVEQYASFALFPVTGSVNVIYIDMSVPESYVWDGAAYEPLTIDTTGFVPYTGATQDVNLGEFGVQLGNLEFDVTPTNIPTAQGSVYWDDNAETLALIMNGTTQRVGEDLFYHVRNTTGSTIPKGTAVRFAGTTGNSGRLLIAPMIANGTTPSQYYMGVTSEEILNNADGKVYQFGKMRGVNTSAFADGDILYVSTTVAGAFQTTPPTAPNNIIVAAAVVHAANNGTLMIRPTLGSNINADEGVLITTPINWQVLRYNSTSGLWVNELISTSILPGGIDASKIGAGTVDNTEFGYLNGVTSSIQTQLDGKVPTSRTLTINGTTQDLSADRSYSIDKASVGLANVDNTSDANKPVSTATQTALNAKQDTLVSGTNIKTINGNSVLGSGDLVVGGSTSLAVGTTPITSGTIGRVLFEGTGNVLQQSANLFWDNTNNRLGIGTNAPANTLDISGSITGASSIFKVANNATNSFLGGFELRAPNMTNNNNFFFSIGKAPSTRNRGLINYFHSSDGSASNNLSFGFFGVDNIFNIMGSSNVLIGTTTDAGFKLDVNGTARVSGNTTIVGTLNAGSSNTVTGTFAVALGQSNTASGANSIALGLNATANNTGCFAFNGTASGIRAIAIGFSANSSNDGSVAIGTGAIASGSRSVSIGNQTNATAVYSQAFGRDSLAYLQGQTAFANNIFANLGDAQQSNLTARSSAVLTTAATVAISLDGTGTTNLIIPTGNNRAWNVTIETIAVVTAIAGTATGVSVGNCYRETKQLLFKRVGGTSSIVGTVDTTAIKSDSGMTTAALTVSAGASQQMALTFTAPTFAGGGSVTCRVVSKVSLVEVAY